MRGWRPGLAAALAICLGAVALQFAGTGVQGAGVLPWQDAEATARGRTLYDAHCAACHGADLEGEPNWRHRDAQGYLPAPPHDETGHTWHHPDAQLLDITRRGVAAVVGGGYRSRMPGYAEILEDDEIIAILAYIKSTWPPEIIETHDRINAEARP